MREESCFRSPVDSWVAGRLGIPLDKLTAERLEMYQLQRIRTCLKYVKENSRYYRKSLAEVEPDEIRTMGDFRRLPTCSEQDLIDSEWMFQCVESTEIRRVVTVPTTGTSGKQKRIRFTENDLRSAMAFAPAGFAVMCEPGDKVMVMMSGGFDGSIGDNVAKGLEPLGNKVLLYGQVIDLADAADAVIKEQPDVIVGMPGQIRMLERYMTLHHMEFSLKSVLLSSDDLPEAMCRQLQESWSCHTFRHYGMTEVCMFGAVECLGKGGYHLRACDILYEVIDPDENGYGEIAITTFAHEGMPLIRYRTGDIGKMRRERCRCGSELPGIAHILGRRKNRMVFRDQAVFLSQVEELIFADSCIVNFEVAYGEAELQLTAIHYPEDKPDVEQILKRFRARQEFEGVTVEIRLREFPWDGKPGSGKKGIRRL